jgi:hypothetical protein
MDDRTRQLGRTILWSAVCLFSKGEEFLNAASNEFFASVENHLYGLGVSTQMSADELDMVNDFALQGFGAVACAENIEKPQLSMAWSLGWDIPITATIN